MRLPSFAKYAASLALAFLWMANAGGAENLSPLGKPPDWRLLEKYQETITHGEFSRLLQSLYCTRGVSQELIQVDAESARFVMDKEEQKWFTLRFATDESSARLLAHAWKGGSLPPASRKRPLAGLKIALDPGHIGGRWAQMEERWFQVGDSEPIQEGNMTLLVAKILAPQLEKLGAKVSLVRNRTTPVTSKRPDELTEVSKKILQRAGEPEPRKDFSGPADPEKEHTIRWQNELLFYRNSEIRARAARMNAGIKPDLMLCLHFNAESWDDPHKPTLVDRNHLHLLVNGSYLPGEIEFDDIRFEMLRRLLSRTDAEELPLAEKLAESMARRTRLPVYEYTTENVTKVGSTGYVYARNLLATRLYEAPVVYFEPYVMNSDEVFWRVQEGDYEGLRNVNGTNRPSIYREYAAGVVDGLVEYYRTTRKETPR